MCDKSYHLLSLIAESTIAWPKGSVQLGASLLHQALNLFLEEGCKGHGGDGSTQNGSVHSV